ncbi:endolytic transglycosylase MltG [Bacillus sp. FJAT-29790]|uniref:endolytic transglycosylase MltG n=1 Tax=Bacillus sp. FJAT-29790 TaxID=1895002 RepID=UPI001C2313C7|nr:endolytic transglycosylase MltG [Bacillus sp. FJAT-29790]MBU8879391.1 endolytic transglycosylase MltG [Bacillus sp. FJAT-29790]
MNKRNTRAFAFGIFVSVCMMGAFYYSIEEKHSADLTIEDAKVLLAEDGYVILTKEQYDLMEKVKEEQVNKEEIPSEIRPDVAEAEAIINTFKLKIVRGMSPYQIAMQLEKANIIDDADLFKNFLKENGYSRKIQSGTFEVSAGMSYVEIATLITKS